MLHPFLVSFATIFFVIICIFMVLTILLQAGRGGGLGTALGGGASQSVFGGGGGADLLAKITQASAAAFMIVAMYLAYASAHTNSSRLAGESEEEEVAQAQETESGDLNWETIGPRPMQLPTADEAKQMRDAASAAAVSLPEDAPAESPAP